LKTFQVLLTVLNIRFILHTSETRVPRKEAVPQLSGRSHESREALKEGGGAQNRRWGTSHTQRYRLHYESAQRPEQAKEGAGNDYKSGKGQTSYATPEAEFAPR